MRYRQARQELNSDQKSAKYQRHPCSRFVADIRFGESCHLTQQPRRSVNDGHGKGGAGTFPEPHLQIEQWLEFKQTDQRRMPALDRAMSQEQIPARTRT